MGDAWEPFLFRSADPGRVSFFRGNSSCLAALIQAGWLYLHTYSNKEACSSSSRKGSGFVFNRSLATELKRADATSYGWNLPLSRCYTRLTNYF